MLNILIELVQLRDLSSHVSISTLGTENGVGNSIISAWGNNVNNTRLMSHDASLPPWLCRHKSNFQMLLKILQVLVADLLTG